MQTVATAEPLTINASAPGALIFKQMIAVMRDVGAIGKNRRNPQGSGYQFRGIDDVYDELHELLARHGVFTVPEVLSDRSEERATRNGGNMIYRILKVAYTFYAEDGSSIRAVVVGEGMDSGDKASNKAMSGAHKYCFLQVFSIPTNEPKDSENESPAESRPMPQYDRSSAQNREQQPPPNRSNNNNRSNNRSSNNNGKPAATNNANNRTPPPAAQGTGNAEPQKQAAPPQQGRTRTRYTGAANHYAQIKTHCSAKWGINDERVVQKLSHDLVELGVCLDEIPQAVHEWVLEYKPGEAKTKAS